LSKILLAVFIFSSLSNAQTLLEQTCREDGGELVNQIRCSNSKKTRQGQFCQLHDKVNKTKMFFNGCTSSVPGFDDLFFKACYYHDHCYHHEPVTSGMSKRDCDQQLKTQLYDVCESIGTSMKRGYTCDYVVNVTYYAVKFGGESSWQCSKTKADYPFATIERDYLPVLD